MFSDGLADKPAVGRVIFPDREPAPWLDVPRLPAAAEPHMQYEHYVGTVPISSTSKKRFRKEIEVSSHHKAENLQSVNSTSETKLQQHVG